MDIKEAKRLCVDDHRRYLQEYTLGVVVDPVDIANTANKVASVLQWLNTEATDDESNEWDVFVSRLDDFKKACPWVDGVMLSEEDVTKWVAFLDSLIADTQLN